MKDKTEEKTDNNKFDLIGIELKNGNTVQIAEKFIDGWLPIRFYNAETKLETTFKLSKDATTALTHLLLKLSLF